jgi:hypothetical protein
MLRSNEMECDRVFIERQLEIHIQQFEAVKKTIERGVYLRAPRKGQPFNPKTLSELNRQLKFHSYWRGRYEKVLRQHNKTKEEQHETKAL